MEVPRMAYGKAPSLNHYTSRMKADSILHPSKQTRRAA